LFGRILNSLGRIHSSENIHCTDLIL
jgi:hypothetical protein